MKILPPGVAFALGLAVSAGVEPRSGDSGATPPPANTAGGPMLLVLDEQGAIVDLVEATGIAEAISAIENSTRAAAPLMILLVPVAGAACEAPAH